LRAGISGVFIPVNNLKNIHELRTYLDPHFLHRDVKVTIRGFEDYGYFVTDLKNPEEADYDVRYDLVKSGYAKLNNQAMLALGADEYKKLKGAQDTAQLSQSGIWANFTLKEGANNTSQTTKSGQSFEGKIIEVVSGDILQVLNTSNGELLRLNLANVKAPGIGNIRKGEPPKPWAFESREFVRNHAIGRLVKVEIDFTKSFTMKNDEGKDENRTLTFATITLPNGKNLSELIIEHGYAQVNMPRAGEDFTPCIKELSTAEEKALNKKLGVHSKKATIRVDKFTDYSGPKMNIKAKQFFDFIKAEQRIPAVVEAVLSGSLYKLRLEK